MYEHTEMQFILKEYNWPYYIILETGNKWTFNMV